MSTGEKKLADAIKNPETFWMMQCHEKGPFFISYKWDPPTEDDGYDCRDLHSDESEIILLTDKGFIVNASYHLPKEWRVTEFDLNGNAIYRIPLDACTAIYDPEEYDCLCQMRDADERLMSYM